MQAVFLPAGQLSLFLAQLKTCPRFRGIFHDPELAANAAWRALEEHFWGFSPRLVDAPGRHPQESAFLTSIFEDPDDVSRLVFADWLEENGQPDRAAFMRQWSVPLIRPEENVEWLFRYGQFSSYDYGTYTGTVRHFITPDAQRTWHHKQYDSKRIPDEEEPEFIKSMNVADVEADLAKLPKLPPPNPCQF
jgi:uncharacterized protein (TIGR02996 family)